MKELPRASNIKKSIPLIYDVYLCKSVCQLGKTVKDEIQLYNMVIWFMTYINYTNPNITTFLGVPSVH